MRSLFVLVVSSLGAALVLLVSPLFDDDAMFRLSPDARVASDRSPDTRLRSHPCLTGAGCASTDEPVSAVHASAARRGLRCRERLGGLLKYYSRAA